MKRVVSTCIVLIVGGVLGAQSAPFSDNLVAISDATMAGSAYADGRLYPIDSIRDTLTIVGSADGPIALDESAVLGEIHAPNSVVSWPNVVEVSPDGRYAYVVETYAEPPAGTEEVEDAFTGLPVGTRLFTFDISNHRAPRLVDERPLGDVMRSVSISRDGTLLAADAAEDHALYLVQLSDGVPDSVHKFAPSALSASIVESSTIHPSGDYVVTVSDSRYLHLFRVARTAEGTPTAVTQVGDVLDTGRDLSVGAFTDDGNYFLIPDVGWGESALSFIVNGRGRLLSVAFDFAEGDHRVVDEARVGRSPEGFALSPDERYAVTVDMRRTYLPARFPFNLFPRTRENSLTLLAFDAQTGELDVLDSQRFSGALPEDATFDSTSRNIAVAVYHDRADVYTGGYIEFWSVDESAEGRATLRRHDGTVPVVRGVHDLHSIP